VKERRAHFSPIGWILNRWDFSTYFPPCAGFKRCEASRMKAKQLKQLSNICLFLGFASILGSIAIWFLTGGTAPESQAHAERFGIFVGLWAPTFMILSNRFDRYADRAA
jgi:hypothetical protein